MADISTEIGFRQHYGIALRGTGSAGPWDRREATGDRFPEAAVNQQVAHLLQGHLPLLACSHPSPAEAAGLRFGMFVVAVDASHFLDKRSSSMAMSNARRVPARSSRQPPTVTRHAEASQDLDHLSIHTLMPITFVELGAGKPDGGGQLADGPRI